MLSHDNKKVKRFWLAAYRIPEAAPRQAITTTIQSTFSAHWDITVGTHITILRRTNAFYIQSLRL